VHIADAHGIAVIPDDLHCILFTKKLFLFDDGLGQIQVNRGITKRLIQGPQTRPARAFCASRDLWEF